MSLRIHLFSCENSDVLLKSLLAHPSRDELPKRGDGGVIRVAIDEVHGGNHRALQDLVLVVVEIHDECPGRGAEQGEHPGTVLHPVEVRSGAGKAKDDARHNVHVDLRGDGVIAAEHDAATDETGE